MPLISHRSGTKVARQVRVLTICATHVSTSSAPPLHVQRVSFQCEGLRIPSKAWLVGLIYAPLVKTPAQLVGELRVSAGLSQRALASRAGCTRSTIVRIENGDMDPTVTMLARITSATGHRLNIRADQTLRKASLAAIAQLVLGVDEPDIPFTRLRGLIDSLDANPNSAMDAIVDPPPRTGNEDLDNLLAAIANKIAEENLRTRPTWTSEFRSHQRLGAHREHPACKPSRRPKHPANSPNDESF